MKHGINLRFLSNKRRRNGEGRRRGKGEAREGEEVEEGKGERGKERRETTAALQFIFSLST